MEDRIKIERGEQEYLAALIKNYFTKEDICYMADSMKKLKAEKEYSAENALNIYLNLAEAGNFVFNNREIPLDIIENFYTAIKHQTQISESYLTGKRYLGSGSMEGIKIYLAMKNGTQLYNRQLIIFMKEVVLEKLGCPINREFIMFYLNNKIDENSLKMANYYYRKNGLVLVMATVVGNTMSYSADDGSAVVTPQFRIDDMSALKRTEYDSEGIMVCAEGEFEEFVMSWREYDGESNMGSGSRRLSFSIKAHKENIFEEIESSSKIKCYFKNEDTIVYQMGNKTYEKKWDFFCGDLFEKYRLFTIERIG